MSSVWKKQKGCRTCSYAEADARDRSYRPVRTHRCTYPVDQLPWPKLPDSLSFAYGVADQLDRIKSGRSKKNVNFHQDGEGANCPMWQEWPGLSKQEPST